MGLTSAYGSFRPLPASLNERPLSGSREAALNGGEWVFADIRILAAPLPCLVSILLAERDNCSSRQLFQGISEICGVVPLDHLD